MVAGICSCADKASVEGAGDGGVGGALDERAAVGKDGDLVRPAAETEQQRVLTEVGDVGVGEQAVLEVGERDGPVMLVDLHGVAAAECDVRTAGTGEVGEAAMVADGAVGVRAGGVDFSAFVGPEVDGEEGATQ